MDEVKDAQKKELFQLNGQLQDLTAKNHSLE